MPLMPLVVLKMKTNFNILNSLYDWQRISIQNFNFKSTFD